MKSNSEQYWMRVTGALRQDGAASVPADLAGRAARAAFDAPARPLSVFDAFAALLGPAVGLGFACAAIIVVAAFLQPASPATRPENTDMSLYTALVGDSDDNMFATRLLGDSGDSQ